jgi:hypothetical protein
MRYSWPVSRMCLISLSLVRNLSPHLVDPLSLNILVWPRRCTASYYLQPSSDLAISSLLNHPDQNIFLDLLSTSTLRLSTLQYYNLWFSGNGSASCQRPLARELTEYVRKYAQFYHLMICNPYTNYWQARESMAGVQSLKIYQLCSL